MEEVYRKENKTSDTDKSDDKSIFENKGNDMMQMIL